MPGREQKNSPTTKQQPDTEWKDYIRRAKLGDKEAIHWIIDEYSQRLYTLFMRLLRNKEDAEDSLQETFITMVQKLPSFRGDAHFYTWLYRIATNIGLMKLRSRQARGGRFAQLSDIDPEKVHAGEIPKWPDQPDMEVLQKETKEILDKAINLLSGPYRAVFILRDIEQFSIEETSKILGITPANVKIRLRRARIFLRNLLGEQFRK